MKDFRKHLASLAASLALCALALCLPAFGQALGYADGDGNFILTEEGARIAKAKKTKILPEARFWGEKPLGAPGHLVTPTNYAVRAKFRKPGARAANGNGLCLFDGKNRAVVVTLTNYVFITRLADEFAYHFGKMTGGEVERSATWPAEGRVAVVFGGEEAARHFGVDLRTLGMQTAVVKRRGNWLYVGGNTVGASHALTYVLESLGCRYLWPGPLGKVIPRRDRVVINETSFEREPELKSRRRQYEYAPILQKKALGFLGIEVEPFAKAWAAATMDHKGNRGFWQWHGVDDAQLIPGARQYELPQRRYRWGHVFGDFRTRFLKEHPEWFSLQRDGTRGVCGSSLCLSSEGLAQQVAQDAMDTLRKDPKIGAASICLPDGDYSSQCMCENCRRLDPVNAPPAEMGVFRPEWIRFPYVSMTDRVLHFNNKVAEIVAREFPDRKLSFFAYSRYGEPPVAVKPHPALFVVNVAGSLTDPSQAERRLAGWASFGNMQVWRPNFLIGFLACIPQSYARVLFGQIEDAKANGLYGFEISNVCEKWAEKGFMYYAVAKAMVNHRRMSFDEIEADYCRAGFGRAAETVRRYLRTVEEASWATIARFKDAKLKGDLDSGYDCDQKGKIAVEELERRGVEAMIAKAAAEAAGDTEALARVRFLGVGIEYLKRYSAMSRAWFAGEGELFETRRSEFFDFVREQTKCDPVAVYPVGVGISGSPFVRLKPKKIIKGKGK